MAERIYGYDYHTCSNKQDVISSIVESRLVPRDMTDIGRLDYAKAVLENAFIFVDNNGKSTKISLTDLSDNVFKIVENIPEEASIGQIILQKIGENQYKLLRLDENNDWQELHLVSDASIINYINENAHLLSENVQDALDELDNHLEDDYWQKKHIKDIALTGEAVDVSIAPIEGLQESTNLQEALEEIFNKTTVGFNVKLNADKIQLYLDYGVNKKVLGANVVEGSLEQSDFNEELNAKLDTIYPNQERITALEDRCANIEDIKADKTDVEDKYTELKDRIATEEDRAITYDNKLQNELDDEIQRAATMEIELAKAINDETNRATSTETANKEELQKNINNEEAARVLEDNNLSARINEEINRAEAAETLIQSNLDTEVSRAVTAETKETSERKDNDKLLQDQIDAINAKSDVVDVVGTKQELIDYDKPLTENDIIKVLKDESMEDATSYYRCSGKEEAISKYIWVFIGTQGPYYTQAKSDDRFVNRNVTINGKALTSNIRLSHNDLDDNPLIGDARITITKNNQEVNSFRLNDTTDTTVNIYVPTKLSEFTDDLGSNPTHTHGQYDTITNVDSRVKILNNSIDLKADKATTYTKTDVDALLKTEKDARIASDNILQDTKQDNLIVGDNITLKDNVISAKDTYYYPGNGITFDDYSGHTDAKSISVDTSILKVNFENISGEPSDNEALKSALDAKATKVELNTNVSAINKDIATINTNIDNLEKSKVDDVKVIYAPDTQAASIVTDNIATLDISSYDLITTRENAIKGVQNSLDNEVERAKEAENKLTNDLSAEVSRAKNAENTLTTNLTDEISRAKSAESTLTTNLNAEITRAKNAENTLTTNLSSEVTRAKNAEAELTTNLSTEVTNREKAGTAIQTALDSEIDRAKKAEVKLTNDLSTEISRAESAENTLTTNLTDEISRAKSAESTLTTNLNTEITRAKNTESILTSDLNMEVARAKSIESEISGDLSTEIATREAADTKLQTAISTEISNRETAINDLNNSKVDKVTGKELSANDFTDTLKSKLDGIENGATNLTVSVEGEIVVVTSL